MGQNSSDPNMINPNYNGHRSYVDHSIMAMVDEAYAMGKIVEFMKRSSELQYEDWSLSRKDAMRRTLKELKNGK
jgi:hypothetical protein